MSGPPSYGECQRLNILSLDGGGTRTLCQLYMLNDVMYRLGFDLKIISSRPSEPPVCDLYPADCFDYIGGAGCGSVIAYFLACGMTTGEAVKAFHAVAPVLASTRLHPGAGDGDSLFDLRMALEECLPRHETMAWDEKLINDLPCRTNVWIAGPSGELKEKMTPNSSESGTVVYAGEPILLNLLPLVLAEVEREMRGQKERVDHTLQLLQAVCPVFSDCDLLLSLGPGSVPTPTISKLSKEAATLTMSEKETVQTDPCNQPTSRTTSFVYLLASILYGLSTKTVETSSSFKPASPPIALAAIPPSNPTRDQSRALNAYIPTRSYGRTYIRMNPPLAGWTAGTPRPGLVQTTRTTGGQVTWPKDWEGFHFEEMRTLTGSYCAKSEVGGMLDRAAEVLRRRDLPYTREIRARQHSGLGSLIYERAGYHY